MEVTAAMKGFKLYLLYYVKLITISSPLWEKDEHLVADVQLSILQDALQGFSPEIAVCPLESEGIIHLLFLLIHVAMSINLFQVFNKLQLKLNLLPSDVAAIMYPLQVSFCSHIVGMFIIQKFFLGCMQSLQLAAIMSDVPYMTFKKIHPN
jgi:hypothetical protein